MIIFNIHAIIQLVLFFLAVGILHVVLLIFGVDFIGSLENRGGEYDALFLLSIVAMYSDIKGIKGRLFYIPVWILSIATIYFLSTTSHAMSGRVSLWWPLFLLLLYPVFLWFHHRKRFNRAKDVLEAIVHEGGLESDPLKFFNAVSGAVFMPPPLFFFSFDFWKLLGQPVMSGDDYLEHYREVLNLRGFNDNLKDPYDKWILELRDKFNSTQSFADYPGDAKKDFKRIVQTITRTIKIIENGDSKVKFDDELVD